jgi:hypothetical protein
MLSPRLILSSFQACLLACSARATAVIMISFKVSSLSLASSKINMTPSMRAKIRQELLELLRITERGSDPSRCQVQYVFLLSGSDTDSNFQCWFPWELVSIVSRPLMLSWMVLVVTWWKRIVPRAVPVLVRVTVRRDLLESKGDMRTASLVMVNVGWRVVGSIRPALSIRTGA